MLSFFFKNRNKKPETRNKKPETRNQKPETRNQKPETRNQKPETRKKKGVSGFVSFVCYSLLNLFTNLLGTAGLEPAAIRLKARCSTY